MYATSDSSPFGLTSNMQNYMKNLQPFIHIGHLKSIRLHLRIEKMHVSINHRCYCSENIVGVKKMINFEFLK